MAKLKTCIRKKLYGIILDKTHLKTVTKFVFINFFNI